MVSRDGETWSVALKDGRRLIMSESRVLREVFGAKRVEVSGA
jgi:hypothetical protein